VRLLRLDDEDKIAAAAILEEESNGADADVAGGTPAAAPGETKEGEKS
jgi:hypothetical protein